MKKILYYSSVLACTALLTGCMIQSKGERAAKEVINCINIGDMEGAKKLMDKYVSTLDAQDLLDFSMKLENAGIM